MVRAKKAAPPPRRRRTAEEAREAILDAAERRLAESGPAGIRLQEVAADVGVSHPTVLHHFGSREALVRAVCERSFAAIHADVVGAIAEAAQGPEQTHAMLDAIAKTIREHGHGRVVLWLALEGHLRDERDVLRLREVGRATHAIRKQKRGKNAPPLEDTLHAVALSAMVLLSESVLGSPVLADAGLAGDDASRGRFRAWFSRLLIDHLLHGPR